MHHKSRQKYLLSSISVYIGLHLVELLETYNPVRELRFLSQLLLTAPKSRTMKAGDRSFYVCAPKLYNNLPYVCNAVSLNYFKSRLKTHLFQIHYADLLINVDT